MKSVDEFSFRPRFYPRRPVPWIHPERRSVLAARSSRGHRGVEGTGRRSSSASSRYAPLYQLEKRGSWPARYEESSGASGRSLESRRTTSRR